LIRRSKMRTKSLSKCKNSWWRKRKGSGISLVCLYKGDRTTRMWRFYN